MLNIAIVALVLNQEAKDQGFGRRSSAAAPSSYLSRENRMTVEKAQVIATRIMIVMYAGIAVALLVIGQQ